MSKRRDKQIFEQQKFTSLLSPKDDRDFNLEKVSKLVVEFPEEYESKQTEILNQGSVGSCHDEETLVLTKTGWKYFKDISMKDELASVNPNTGELIFEHPTNIIIQDYSGDMIVGKHKSLNFKVTPNHKMVVRKWDEKIRKLSTQYDFIDASDLGWYSGLLNSFHQHKNKDDEECIIFEEEKTSIGHILKRMEINLHDWIQFLGIYLAEGTAYIDGTKSHYRIQLAAYKQREKTYIKNLLHKMGLYHFNEQKDRFQLHNKRIWNKLKEYGLVGKKSYEKFVPKFIFDLDESYIRDFLYGFYMGDGSNRMYGGIAYYTSSPFLRDAIELALILSGSNCSVFERPIKTDCFIKGRQIKQQHVPYVIVQNFSNNLSIDRKKHITVEHYDGKVYCAEVPTYHTLITKRGKDILLSGNCVAHSCASTMMTCEEHSVKKHNNYSRGYIYANRRDTDYQGEGMYPRQALKQLNKCGDVLYDDFPYNIEYPEIKQKLKGIEDELAEKASQHKIVNYYRCYTNDDIKSTIINRGACIICVPVYENFGRDLEKPEGKLRGYHAMTIIGWTKDYWIVQNSWGKNWGYKGKLHMSYDYPWDEAWGLSVELDNINPVPERNWLEKLILIIKNWFKNLFRKK